MKPAFPSDAPSSATRRVLFIRFASGVAGSAGHLREVENCSDAVLCVASLAIVSFTDGAGLDATLFGAESSEAFIDTLGIIGLENLWGFPTSFSCMLVRR